jgi:spermidine synthase
MRIRNINIYFLVFSAGMTTMATEMSGSRLLAPFFGNSLFIWANLIGLILIYLTVGYYLGGRLADRYPESRLLYALTMTAAVTIALLPFIARPVMQFAIKGIDEISAGAFLGSFSVTVLLFAIPITILGMVPPFAIRLRMTSVESAGNVSGGLYALSTMGSIIGTFAPVLLLIPWIGTRNTMLLFAAVLALVSAIGLGRIAYAGAPLIIAAALLIPQGAIKASENSIFETESPYHYIQVEERGGTRYLKLNEGWAVHSAYNPDQTFYGNYWDYFLLAPWFADSEPPHEVLNIGSAAGTIPKLLITFYPGVHVDGVELDPDIVDVGREFFAMDDEPDLTIHVQDGRPFLKTSNKTWDFIAVDAYRQPYIPFYLTTREFFTETFDHMTANGTLMINVGKTPGDSAVADAIAATMKDVYPSVFSISAGSFNELIIATKEPSSLDDFTGRIDLMPEEVVQLARKTSPQFKVIEPGGTILTDDKAPVEWLTDQMIINYATGE